MQKLFFLFLSFFAGSWVATVANEHRGFCTDVCTTYVVIYRVTRWFCEKFCIPKYSTTHFCQKFIHNIDIDQQKISTKILATSVIKKPAKSRQSHKRRKFTPTGHPSCEWIDSILFATGICKTNFQCIYLRLLPKILPRSFQKYVSISVAKIFVSWQN
jgi:hypothetical protein